jgi:formate dehydrogenase subunit gamma
VKGGGTVGRYTAGSRANHWLTAICLILLALSGMAFFHPSLFFLTDLFGGGVWTRIIHPWIGVVLMLSFLGLFLRFWHHNLWRREDSRWMASINDVINNREERLPEVGRYNAGQKLVFWLMSLAVLLMFVSGLVLWDEYFAAYFTVDQKRLAGVLHAAGAVLFCFILIVHVYAAFWVKGTLRAMTRGSVTGGWAWKHHRKWLREEIRTPAKGTGD